MNNTIEFPVTEPSAPPSGETPGCDGMRDALNHKLRTPLNAIIGFAELLALRPDARRAESDVQQILIAAREMLQIIEVELSDEPPKAAEALNERRTCDVLYVEDDAVNFTLVERILEYRPLVKLLHAPKGELGLQLANAYRPKLILLDLSLPDMHGSEVLRKLQEAAETSDIPVVILSANATPTSLERLLAAGPKNYLTKPFNIDHFLTVVDEYIAA